MEEKIRELITILKNSKRFNDEVFNVNQIEIINHCNSQEYVQQLRLRNHYILGENNVINRVLEVLESEKKEEE